MKTAIILMLCFTFSIAATVFSHIKNLLDNDEYTADAADQYDYR